MVGPVNNTFLSSSLNAFCAYLDVKKFGCALAPPSWDGGVADPYRNTALSHVDYYAEFSSLMVKFYSSIPKWTDAEMFLSIS